MVVRNSRRDITGENWLKDAEDMDRQNKTPKHTTLRNEQASLAANTAGLPRPAAWCPKLKVPQNHM
jgi:hypothetical protein